MLVYYLSDCILQWLFHIEEAEISDFYAFYINFGNKNSALFKIVRFVLQINLASNKINFA